MSATDKLSFTVRRPTPSSRGTSSGADSDNSSFKTPHLPRHITSNSNTGSPLARSATSSPRPRYDYDSSSGEDDEVQDELVTGFDKFGVQRAHKPRKAPQGPLVIPALKNRDWREIARKRRTANQFVPESGKAQTGADGSVGGLGTRDSINSGPVLSGLQIVKSRSSIEVKDEEMEVSDAMEDVRTEILEEEDEDKKALRAILASVNGQDTEAVINAIPIPISETEALKQDVEELPDSASLDDYSRVPVSQFGAAMLRGMGWKEGTSASRKPGKGMVEPYLPSARPALLGIGAKEQEVYDDGSTKKKYGRPERKYVPVVKRESSDSAPSRRRSISPRRSNSAVVSSRRNSRSPDRRTSESSRQDRDRDYERRRERDHGDERDRSRRHDRDSHKERSRDSERRRRD